MTVNTTELSSTQIDAWITPARLAPYVTAAGAHHKSLIDVPVEDRLAEAPAPAPR